MLNQEFVPRNDVPKEAVRQAIYEYCADESGLRDRRLPIWNLFERIDFDLDRFFMEDKYLCIDKEVIDYNDDGTIRYHDFPLYEIVMGCLFQFVKPVSEYLQGEFDGYIDLLDTDGFSYDECDIMKYLYFCRTEEDIWKMFCLRVGGVGKLYNWYMGISFFPVLSNDSDTAPYHPGKNVTKAIQFLEFVLNNKTNYNIKIYDRTYHSENVYNRAKELYERHFEIEKYRKQFGEIWSKTDDIQRHSSIIKKWCLNELEDECSLFPFSRYAIYFRNDISQQITPNINIESRKEGFNIKIMIDHGVLLGVDDYGDRDEGDDFAYVITKIMVWLQLKTRIDGLTDYTNRDVVKEIWSHIYDK